MKTVFNFLMSLTLILSFSLLNEAEAQRRTASSIIKYSPNEKPCQDFLTLNLAKGAVANPNHTKSRKVRTQVIRGQFSIQATSVIKENHYQWAKFSFKPGYPQGKIKAVSVRYSVLPSPNNAKKTCYISQTRMIQGPSANKGTVKIDDGKNLFGSGQHTATPLSGAFLCGNNTKTVSLKLVMQPGDKIIIRSIKVHFECVPPVIIDYFCPQNLPNPKIKLASKKPYSTNAGSFMRYRIPVINSGAYPDWLFAADANLPACGANNNSARTWVDIYNGRGQRIYGFCALGKASDLKNIWFSVKKGKNPPKRVRIKMTDRGCNKEYISNWIPIN